MWRDPCRNSFPLNLKWQGVLQLWCNIILSKIILKFTMTALAIWTNHQFYCVFYELWLIWYLLKGKIGILGLHGKAFLKKACVYYCRCTASWKDRLDFVAYQQLHFDFCFCSGDGSGVSQEVQVEPWMYYMYYWVLEVIWLHIITLSIYN